jgi:hypothetical protein
MYRVSGGSEAVWHYLIAELPDNPTNRSLVGSSENILEDDIALHFLCDKMQSVIHFVACAKASSEPVFVITVLFACLIRRVSIME